MSMPVQPPRENLFQPLTTQPPPRSPAWIWLVAGGLIAAMCLCSGLCVVPLGLGVYQAVNERSAVEQEVTAFLADMQAQRFRQAAARFSSRALRVARIDAASMEKLGTENKAFQDGRAAHVATINFSRSFNTNPDMPQGVVATVAGTIDYTGGGRGTFRATLEKEDGQWRLHLINIERQN